MKKAKKGKRKKRGVDYWHQRYMKLIKTLSDEDRELVDSYRPDFRKGIDLSTQDRVFQNIEDLDAKKECLELEELIFYIPRILRSRPSHEYVTNGVKRFTDNRKYSWFDDVIRKKEYLDILHQDVILQIDPENMSVDFAMKEQDWSYSLSGQNVNNANPLDFLILSENKRTIYNAIKSISSSGKHAKSINRIFEMMFDGTDVTGKNAEEIGVPQKKMASIKSQALSKLTKKILKATDDAELVERHTACKAKKGKNYKIKKSTLEQRKALYRKEEDHPPIATRIWKLINGELTLIQDDRGPLLNAKSSPSAVKNVAKVDHDSTAGKKY